MKKNQLLRIVACMLLACISHFSFAQERQLTGVIRDESGTPLLNATVAVKGTRLITTTDQNGAFRLTVPNSATTAIVSYVGMLTQEVPIGGKTSINVSLKVTDEKLSEVVVIGYGTRRRADINSAISSVSEKDIRDLPVAGADQAIQGKIAGVTVINNGGQPGGGVSVRVRGITTINGNEPLYVVDGVPIISNTTSTAHDVLGGGAGQTSQSVLATLNPNDIASIDVLKDASAQAIYGSLAANGVVLITTKRGKAGEGRITYDTYFGWQEVPQRLDVMNLQQYAQYRNEIGVEAGNPSPEEFANPSILGKGTNWQDGIFQVGHIQNHQLSFSGGRDKTTYYLSFNYFDQTGTVIGSKFNRYSVRFNLDNQLKSWFRSGISVNASMTEQRITLTNESDGIVSTALIMNPAIAITNPDGSWGGRTEIGGNNYGENYNPVALALLRDVRSGQSKVFGNLYGEIQFTPNLTFRNELGYDFQLSENKAFQPTYKMGNTVVDVNRLREDKSTNFYWVFKSYVNFNKTFGGRHDIGATVGHEASSWKWANVLGERVNLATDNIQALNTGSTQGQNTGGGKGDGAIESYFARLRYTYDNKYSIEGTLRRDGSSNFGPNNNIGYFPGVSAGWTISNEGFFEKQSVFDYLKLRVGAGAVGNQQTGQTAAYVTKVTIRPTPFGPGGVPGNVGNPDLKWESAITYNAGIDATLLNRRLEFSVDVYKKVSSDFLLQAVLPSFTGLGTAFNDIQSPVVNAGQMTNKGIDLSITSYNIQKKDFTWRTNFILSHYKNRLDKLNDSSAVITGTVQFGTLLVTRTVAGQPVGQFYGFVTDGIFRTMDELNAGIYQGLPLTPQGTYLGDIRFRNIDPTKSNGEDIIDDKDVTFIGNPHPKFTFGLTNTFSYKSLDLSIFLHGSVGAKILNFTRRLTEGMNDLTRNQLASVLDRYTATNTDGTLPRFNNSHQNNLRVSDRFVENGSYLRIQNISVGYKLPERWANKAKLASIRVYASAQNIYTFTDYSGYDPELGAYNKDIRFMNIDNGSYPVPRTFTVGVNVEL